MGFLQALEYSKNEVFCDLVLRKYIGWLFRGYSRRKQRALSFTLLFLVCEILILVVILVTKSPFLEGFVSSIFAALIASLSFYVVSWCHQYTQDEFFKALNISSLGEELEQAFSRWLKRVVNLWFQVLTSVITSTLALVFLHLVEKNVGLPFEYNTVLLISVFLAVFGMAQGGYWAVVSPLITNHLKPTNLSKIREFPLHPSRIPFLKAISKIFSAFALWDALMVSLCLFGIFTLQPDFAKGGMIYILLLILTGYVITFWTFVYPQIKLAGAVQYLKEKASKEILLQINKEYTNFQEMENSNFERLKFLTDLHKTLVASPNTLINLAGIQSFFVSLLTPTLIGILGALNWETIFRKLF